MFARLAALLTGASLAACSVVGVRDAEEPKFQVVDHVGPTVEVRQYGPRVAAETAVAGDEIEARSGGFRRLAGYIFGKNRSRTEIAMTAPVAQRQDRPETIAMTAPVAQTRDEAGQWVIRFFMPATYTMETLPEPLDPAVRLVAAPGETMAVLRFSGSIAPEAVAAKQGELLSALQGSRTWQPDGTIVAWFYDPPWTLPPFRRNEVAVPVARR